MDHAGLISALKGLSSAHVLVVGDVMLDRFVYGDVSRVSPEGPVPVLGVMRRAEMAGGAGNVVSNLLGLGVKTSLVSLVGPDGAGEQVRELLKDAHVSLVLDPGRPTPVKTRFIARGQQLLRADEERVSPVTGSIETDILKHIESYMKDAGAVILSDYGKGVLTSSVIKRVIELADQKKVPVIVDPKGDSFAKYNGANVITPNRYELSLASGNAPVNNDDDVAFAAQKIIDDCGIDAVVATRSEDGMTIVQRQETGNGFEVPVHLKTQAQEIFDVSGAGDTVVATLGALMAAGADLVSAAQAANAAAGIVVGKVGTAPVRLDELQACLAGGSVSVRSARVASREDAAEQVRQWQAQGLKVGFTNGCFDILHSGHVNYLNQARDRCDRLVVGLNHDASVRILKGPERPVNDEQSRATVIGALGSVDMVVLFGALNEAEDNTPCALIDFIRPDVFFKGGDYTPDTLPEAKIVQAYGGKVAIMPLYDGYSTTSTLEKIKKNDKAA